MPRFEADFTADTYINGIIPLEDVDYDDRDQFEFEARNYVHDNFDGVRYVEILHVKEID